MRKSGDEPAMIMNGVRNDENEAVQAVHELILHRKICSSSAESKGVT
jgi:hypothetical protein